MKTFLLSILTVPLTLALVTTSFAAIDEIHVPSVTQGLLNFSSQHENASNEVIDFVGEGNLEQNYMKLFSAPQSMLRPLNHHRRGSYFDWGQAQSGWGYCYEYTSSGQVLNGGSPVSDDYCERYDPSYYDWGQATNGWGYCYHFTPKGVPMNQGTAQPNYECERYAPSYFTWGTGADGHAYCYQYTARNVAMNEGRPVSNDFCR